ncbi:DUF6876 family protein [Phormidium sp. CCY1219]|uniref:DUF6876 family protein n=1 Tax=Phormidium sp. CCY1219 TaxID=2886104 RepID=UPI002D1E72B4|nr:DUF6876 family protein [Phormidium sp. CCY1219]MEB3830109.1 hypothetical protein [Phormidium sp. CCY1219]
MQPITQADLARFQGTTNYYRHWLNQFKYTDGVKYLADAAEAHWLIDAIASYQRDERVTGDEMLQEFQIWQLSVSDGRGTLTLLRDTDDPVLSQDIEYTDFPLDEIKLYLSGGVLMLPSEY